MEPYCGREGSIVDAYTSGDIRVAFDGAQQWTYNPLAVRLAGDVPFAPLTLREAAVGQRVRVSRSEVRSPVACTSPCRCPIYGHR